MLDWIYITYAHAYLSTILTTFLQIRKATHNKIFVTCKSLYIYVDAHLGYGLQVFLLLFHFLKASYKAADNFIHCAAIMHVVLTTTLLFVGLFLSEDIIFD